MGVYLIHNGTGGIDKDTDFILADINGNAIYQPNDYFDALNIRPKSQSGNNSFGNEVIKGTGLKVTSTGVVEQQEEVAYVYMKEGASSLILQYSIYDASGAEIYTANNNFGGAANYNDVYVWLSIDLLTTFPDATFAHAVDGEYFQINFVGSTQQYTIKTSFLVDGSTMFEYPQFVIVNEYISEAMGGSLIPIASCDVAIENGSAMFVLSTTNNGVGEIGVITYDAIIYTYTRLLRSTKFNFNVEYLPEVVGERTSDKVSLYWVDGNNFDRYFYYYGAFTQDGALAYLNPPNIYDYASIDLQLRQQKYATGTNLALTTVNDNGGRLLSGIKQYFAVFYEEAGQAASYGLLSYPVPVAPTFWNGGSELEVTTKSHELTISGVDSNVFPFMRLGVVEQANRATSIYLLPRVSTSSNDFIVTHTGFETTQAIDAAYLSLVAPQLLHSLNNLIFNRRYYKSNLQYADIYDFSTAAATLTLETAEYIQDNAEDPYMDTLAVNNDGNYDPKINMKLGYMDNETYRMGIMIEFKNGAFSPTYHIGDITIDVTAFTNGASLTTTQGALGASPDSELIQRVIRVTNWTAFWADPTISSLIDTIERVHIMRVECVPEVLATGLAFAAQKVASTPDYYSQVYINNSNITGTRFDPAGLSKNLKYINFISPDTAFTNTEIEYLSGDKVFTYDGLESLGVSTETIDSGSGETVLCDRFATTQDYISYLFQYSGFNNVVGYTQQDIANTFYINPTNKTVTTVSPSINNTGSSDTFTITGTDVYEENVIVTSPATFPKDSRNYYNSAIKSHLLVLGTDLGTSYWGKYVQYFRPLNDKYGDAKDNSWFWVGSSQSTGITTDIDCFGGDTYIQKTAFRMSTMDSKTDDMNSNLVFSFFSQNKVNTTYRNADGIPAYIAAYNQTWSDGIEQFMVDSTTEGLNYQLQYTPRHEQLYISYNPLTITSTELPTRIIYSSVNPTNSLIDYYREFLVNNYKDLDLTNGAISTMKIVNQNFVTWQLRMVMQQIVDNYAVAQADGTSIILGDGSVLSRNGIPITTYGTNMKWAVLLGKSSGGDSLCLWWAEEYEGIIRFGSEGTHVISDECKISLFIRPACKILTNCNDKTLEWGNSIRGVYDHKNREYLWTIRAALGTKWLDDVEYDTNTLVWVTETDPTTFDNKILVFIATTSVPANTDPRLPSIYWYQLSEESSYAAYTIVYSIIKNRFTSFYGFRPRLYMPFRDSYLTPAPLEITTPINNLYLHEIFENDNGRAACFYETMQSSAFGLDLLVNTSNPYRLDCVGISTFMPYPDAYRYQIYVPNTTTYWAIREVHTDYVILYEPYSGGDILSGTAFIVLCWGEEPYITHIDNVKPIAYKRPHASEVMSNIEPIKIEYEVSSGQESFLTNYNTNNGNKSDFKDVDNEFRSGIHRDTTNNPTNNTISGNLLKGFWYKSKVMFRVGIVTRIHQLKSKFRINNQN